MSHAEKVTYTIIAVSIAVSLLSILGLVSQSYRELITKRLVFLALMVTPLMQLLVFIFSMQVSYANKVADSADGFICSGFHGGGLSTDCSIYEVVLEGIMAAVVFSFITFGLVPLAIFLVTLLVLISVNKYSSR